MLLPLRFFFLSFFSFVVVEPTSKTKKNSKISFSQLHFPVPLSPSSVSPFAVLIAPTRISSLYSLPCEERAGVWSEK